MKDMKWLYNMVITFFAAGCLTACSDYLEVDSNFKDRLTIEKVFTDKDYTDAWLSNTYSYLRGQNQDVGGKESVPTNFADDIYWADWNNEGMVNIPMVVIILFSEMWNTMKIGIRILIKRVI